MLAPRRSGTKALLTDENTNRIIQGHMNTQLNDRGREQAVIVGAALRRVPFTHAFTSDLSRAEDVSVSSIHAVVR